MKTNALLSVAAATAGMFLLAWPAPREEKPRDAIEVVRGAAPPPADAWSAPRAAAVSIRQPTSPGAAGPAHYAWEVAASGEDDAPRDPGIWATPAEFAPPE